MFEANENWELFGYDVRQLGKYWRAAWQEFLWGYSSPVKSRLDEVVAVRTETTLNYYHAGERVAYTQSDSEAILLPDELVLQRELTLPLAVESDLGSVMALEVMANSPFPADDTGFGWRVSGRTETHLQLKLAIVSLSATMTYLGRHYDCHDARAYEVWAEMSESVICISGFGEQSRLARYNKRLIRVAATLGYCALVILLIFGLSAASKYRELVAIQGMSEDVQQEASNAIDLRESLSSANEAVVAVNKVVEEYPSPHYELTRLSKLLSDDAYVLQVNMQGRSIKLRGRAKDAAAVMQQLTQEPSYDSVMAPQAISKVASTDLEQFYLSIELPGGIEP
ncbi:MAG: PilN domain-containing protein [Halioglobus sp.]